MKLLETNYSTPSHQNVSNVKVFLLYAVYLILYILQQNTPSRYDSYLDWGNLLFSMFGREVLDWYFTPIRPISFKRPLKRTIRSYGVYLGTYTTYISFKIYYVQNQFPYLHQQCWHTWWHGHKWSVGSIISGYQPGTIPRRNVKLSNNGEGVLPKGEKLYGT